MSITITEALAEIKTIAKRLDAKRQFITTYLARQDGIRDPLARDGGSETCIREARQSILDLGRRIIELRRGIQAANDATFLTINGVTRTISEWLVWRRDVAPSERTTLSALRVQLEKVRADARRLGSNIISGGAQAEKASDIIVNISEADLAKETELFEDTLGQLDGLLSLKNATVRVLDRAHAVPHQPTPA